jgi:hypothetical protein
MKKEGPKARPLGANDAAPCVIHGRTAVRGVMIAPARVGIWLELVAPAVVDRFSRHNQTVASEATVPVWSTFPSVSGRRVTRERLTPAF